MTASLSVASLYVKSKLEVIVGENSLLSRVLDIPRSFVNMMSLIPYKILYSKDDTALWTKYWRYGWSLVKMQPVVENKEDEAQDDDDLAVRDSSTQKVNAFAITRLYFYILDNRFFGITRQSLELLRHESKVLEGLQDFELLTTLKSLFGYLPEDGNHVDQPPTNLKTYSSVKELLWKASNITWKIISDRLFTSPVISWIFPVYKFSDKNESASTITQPTTSTTNSTIENEGICQSSPHTTVPSAGSLLMCETGLLPPIISDSGTYALSATHDLLKEAVLLFVPMEILENTTELLKDPSLAVTLSPMSAFWQLFNYVSIWGLDIMDEMCNQPEINYVAVDDDDFHFVVNVPKLRRPVMFIGIR